MVNERFYVTTENGSGKGFREESCNSDTILLLPTAALVAYRSGVFPGRASGCVASEGFSCFYQNRQANKVKPRMEP